MNKAFITVLLAVFLAAAFTNSCSKAPKDENSAADRGKVVAKVNGQPIHVGDVREEFVMLPDQLQRIYMTPEGAESLLEELVKKELLYREAAKRGFDKDAKYGRQVEEFKKRLLIEYLLKEEIEQKTLVSDKMVRDFYEENEKSFVREVPGENKSEKLDFDRVEELIRERLIAEQQRAAFETYVDELRKGANIETDKEALRTAFSNSVSQ